MGGYLGGGLGHLAVPFAKAMGLHVVAVDMAHEKLELAMKLGADLAVNALEPDAAQRIVKETDGGAHGVLVTAVSAQAFALGADLLRMRERWHYAGDFPRSIFDVVLNGKTVRGSIVGTGPIWLTA
jgi:alcohol dehydrogenase, propanol-preferring